MGIHDILVTAYTPASEQPLEVKTYIDRLTMSRAAAQHAARALRHAIDQQGGARMIAATGASQFDLLDALTAIAGIDWPRVEMFHLDEYVGLPIDHPASFRKYPLERLIVKTGIARYHPLDVNGTLHASPMTPDASSTQRPSTLHSSRSARTVTWPSTIPLPI